MQELAGCSHRSIDVRLAPQHPLNMRSIETLHRQKKTGKVSDKWDSYLPVYDRLFGPRKDDAIDLLEIGIQNGGSLEIWSQFFVNARRLVGCDINPRCAGLKYSDKRISVVVGNANESGIRARIQHIAAKYDFIIDDGSHTSEDIFQSFVLYFSMVRPGGIYVVEDTHTLYWPKYGGDLHSPRTATSFFKLFADLVNYEHWKESSTIEDLLGRFFKTSSLPEELSAGWVDSIEFRNSMIIIRKARTATHAKVGKRLITGTEAMVEESILKDSGRSTTGARPPKGPLKRLRKLWKG